MIPRNEYPRPQMVRTQWKNLNGTWQFQFDHGRSCRELGMHKYPQLESTITVPFCVESKLSGVEHKDFMDCVWYKKTITLTESDLEGNRILFHIAPATMRPRYGSMVSIPAFPTRVAIPPLTWILLPSCKLVTI